MTTPIHNDPTAIQEKALKRMLGNMIQICNMLTIWETKQTNLDVPLTNLVVNEARSARAAVTLLRSQVTERIHVSPESVLQTSTKVSATLHLLYFHKEAESSGQVGALNALYAQRYILGHGLRSDSRRYADSEDDTIQLGLGLKDHLAALTQQNPAETITEKILMERFERQLPSLVDFFTRAREQAGPRYVYNYRSLADIPYALDPAAEVFPGSYGSVQKVSHKRTGAPLAMKTFHEVFSNKQMKKILEEIGILEVCNHKNIVQFVQAFRTDDNDQFIRLVMHPWAPYTLLRFLYSPDVKRKAHCPWFELGSPKSNRCIYQIMYDLADAVDYLHSHSIKHKDLKSDNILLYKEASEYPTALITDVGVSKIYRPGNPTNFKDSTYEYLAPEQHAMKESTFKSDVWQLGCCFAELLAVANKGQAGYEELQESFLREDEGCQCSIALEYPSFMEALGAICMRGKAAQKKAYAVVVGMLELDPQLRPSIDSVKAALVKLPGVNTEGFNG